MKGRVERAEKQLAALGPDADPWVRHQTAARVRRFADLLKQWTASAPTNDRDVEVQALRIGDLAIVAMAGEPFAEIGAAVRKASPFAFTMFCGYSDGVGGDYMPTDDEYQHGGYEVERTLYGPGAADRVVAAATRLLESLR